jgi:glycosyltransferase involved in cell wall biosynthesis
MNAAADAPNSTAVDQPRKSLIIEGWRFLPHSYAIVNQWQLLALLRRGVALKVIDAPFYRASWQAQPGLFEPDAEQMLRSITIAQPGDMADVTLRMFAPFTFMPSRSRVTAVFATLEEQVIRRHQMADAREYEQMRRALPPGHVKVVTPSRWSAEGFYNAGFAEEQVLVIPHGVDPGTFHPRPEVRQEIRSGIPVPDDAFVFLSVGAMSGNKGIDLLLRGFAEVVRTYPQARLVLKGVDDLYTSRRFLEKAMQAVSPGDRQRVLDRMTYLGDSLSHRGMAMLYQVADAYVSPYRAEGFNIPVLEAVACGIPVICTRGGPTDDFVTEQFARRIASRKTVVSLQGHDGWRLEPDFDHLVGLMRSVIEDAAWGRHAAQIGPRHAAANYSWDYVADRLVGALLA